MGRTASMTRCCRLSTFGKSWVSPRLFSARRQQRCVSSMIPTNPPFFAATMPARRIASYVGTKPSQVQVLRQTKVSYNADRCPVAPRVITRHHGGGGGAGTRPFTPTLPPPLPPCWVLARKCRTMGAKGALRKFCLT